MLEDNDLTGAPKDAVPGLLSSKFQSGNARKRQQAELVTHMQGTVVKKETVTRNGKPVTQLTMLDGSKQVYARDATGETTQFYDAAGKLYASRSVRPDGSIRTELLRDGKSPIVVVEPGGGGDAQADVDGVKRTVPSSADIASALAGGGVSAGVSALDPYIKQPPYSAMSFLTTGQAATVEAGMRVSGPGLAILGTAVSVGLAEDSYSKCVAGYAGGSMVAGEVGLMLAAPPLRPFTAFLASGITATVAGSIGGAIGRALCN